MTEYYYLNAQREPQGPYSLEELANIMASGRINPTTLVACKGGASWEPLGSVLSQENGEALSIPPIPGPAGNCPSCKHDLTCDLQDQQLPTRCPQCQRPLRPEKKGIWANFCFALRHYARFSGRATRAEYWSFVLISNLFALLIYAFIAGSVAIALLELHDSGMQELLKINNKGIFDEQITSMVDILQQNISHFIPALIGVSVLLLWWLFLLIPAFAVFVRRLHDVGWSGWWILIQQILSFIPLLLLLCYPVMYSISGEAQTVQEENLFHTLSNVGSLIDLASSALALFLFVLTLLNSQRGANKYGASPKYPCG